MMNNKIGNENSVIFYEDDENNIKVEVNIIEDDVWLNSKALAELFKIDRSGITKHINDIYQDKELEEKDTCANFAHVGTNGKQHYNTKYYNLDMIISIGFRVNSKQAIKFRRWTNI